MVGHAAYQVVVMMLLYYDLGASLLARSRMAYRIMGNAAVLPFIRSTTRLCLMPSS